MIGRTARRGRRHASKAERSEVQSFDEGLDHMDRVVLVDPIVEALGWKAELRSVGTLDETTHPVLPLSVGKPYLTRPFSHSQGQLET